MNQNRTHQSDRQRLRDVAIRVMRARGLDPDFSQAELAEAAAIPAAPSRTEEPVRDLRALLWCSIDNDDSRDLDQLSVAQPLPGAGAVKVLVAIADVDAGVPKASLLDRHAGVNTTSVYTPAVIFPMLPERLSTDLTSLVAGEDRLAVVIEFVVSADGSVNGGDVYGANVRNKAKLAYNSVGAWLAGTGPLPAAAAGMDAQLKLQDGAAQALSRRRHEQGALQLATIEARADFDGDMLRDLRPDLPNRAKALIENLMVAANGVTARFLEAKAFPSIRRVVRTPKRWDRIVAIASATQNRLPAEPDSRALSEFLMGRQAADPDSFPDLSQTIIKLLGSGEYVVDPPGVEAPGHFGLAVKDYAHSTAPNRRYPDLLSQRLVKAALAGRPSPYAIGELAALAARCTAQEDAAQKVERQVQKSAAALLVASRVGQEFDGLVTGASPKGTFVRIVSPPIEGKVVSGERGLDVGDRVRVRLSHVDVDRGFIDFVRTSPNGAISARPSPSGGR
jgi:VacB/RNase II family 3'-5' exoribonuclease